MAHGPVRRVPVLLQDQRRIRAVGGAGCPGLQEARGREMSRPDSAP